MQCTQNNATRKVNINASSSTATTAAETHCSFQLTQRVPVTKVTKLLQLTSNHKTITELLSLHKNLDILTQTRQVIRITHNMKTTNEKIFSKK